MSGVITGIIGAKAGDGRAIKVGDVWYGVFKSEELGHLFKGDKVEFTFRDSGKYKNIVGEARLVEKAPSEGLRGGFGDFQVRVPDVERQAAIIRQNALTNAVTFLSRSPDATVDDVIMTAKAFYYYTSGQNEKDAALVGDAF